MLLEHDKFRELRKNLENSRNNNSSRSGDNIDIFYKYTLLPTLHCANRQLINVICMYSIFWRFTSRGIMTGIINSGDHRME